MDNHSHFFSTINDKDFSPHRGGSISKYLNPQKIYSKRPSFISQNSPHVSELGTKIYNNNKISKLPKVVQEKIKQYKLYPIKQLNLKVVGEDIKHKLFEERSSLSKEEQKYLIEKAVEKSELEKKINKSEVSQNLLIEEKKEKNDENKKKIWLNENRKKKKKGKKEKKSKFDKSEQFVIKYRKLDRIKNLYDSNDDDETEDEKVDVYVINPESPKIIIFDFFIIFFFLYYFFATTIFLCHEKCFCYNEKNISFSDMMLFLNDLFCIADLIISFFRSYYNSDYKLVKSNKLILKYYFKYDFIFDFLSAIPIFSISKYICLRKNFHELCYKYEMPNNYIALKICSLLKATKIKKVLGHKKNQALDRFIELISENYAIERTFIIFLYILKYIGIFHFFVCLHIFIGSHSYSNWLVLSESQNESFFHIYITSLYFIVTTLTTVGYGDIVCHSLLERIFQIIILAIGSVLYPYVISSIGNFIKNDSNAKIKHQNDLTMLENIRRDYPNIPFKLYNKIYKHLESKSCSLEKYDVNSFIESLPFNLKNNILFTMYKTPILTFKFFQKNNNSVFIAEVLNNFIPSISKKNEFLLFEGEMVEEIIFIKDGKITFNAAINTEDPMKSINKYFAEKFSAFTTEEEKKLMNENMNNKSNISHLSHIGDLSYDKAKNRLNNAFKIIKNEKIEGEKSQFQLNTNIDINENYDFDIKGGAIINDEGNYQYLKILDIRKNEHFGCVFMTLNKPCPLSLQVKSKLAELFLLKKDQAVNLSKSYPNIWRKIYGKEFHNLRTMKKKTFSVLRKYIEINKLLINNNIEELMLTNDISTFDLNFMEKSIFADKSLKKSHLKQSNLSKQEMSKNNTLNYECDKKQKKLNLEQIKVNLKSKFKKNNSPNIPIKRNSTEGEKKIQLFPNKNIVQYSSSKLNLRSVHFAGSNYLNNIFRSNKDNSYNKSYEEKQRIKKEKLKKVKLFFIECKKYFVNNKYLKETSSFRSNKTNKTENNNNNLYIPKISFKKSCLKKKNSPLGEINYKINIIKDNISNNSNMNSNIKVNKGIILSSKNMDYNLTSSKEKNLKLNFNNINNKFKTNDEIINDLKDICEEETNFSFCSEGENYYKTNQLIVERRANFEICSSYSNLNHITKGKYIKDINFQKKLKLILKKYYLYKHKESVLNNDDSLSLKTLDFSSGFESNIYLGEYEKLKNKLEHKKLHQIITKKSSEIHKEELGRYNSFYGTNKFNKMINKKKNFDKKVNKTQIRHKKSLTSKKLSFHAKETKKNLSLFSTFKIPNHIISDKLDGETIETNSLKVNKSKTSSLSNKSSNKKNKNIKRKESIDVDIKKDVNIFNNTEVEFVIDGKNDKIINDEIFLDKNYNNDNNYRIYKNRKKKKKHHEHNKTINERNKEIINQVLGINIPDTNIITNNIITTTSNIKDNKEVEKIKNIETSFSIYNIIQKNINKNLNIIDNKENSPQRNYSHGFCIIT